MMQATISLFLMLPTLTYLPGVFPFLTKFPYLTHDERPLTRGHTGDPSGSAQRWMRADVLLTYA
jgi:hypothetical protein